LARPKSAILTRPFFVQQNVLRLDIAVHETLVVGILQGIADLRNNLERESGIECASL
jgi:hypothetical protein